MRFWFVHSGEVPIQDQLVTQVSLGILSGELGPGERLPSVRELARRFRIHPNTVSLAYQRLQRERWVVARRGSGIYVREGEAPRSQTAAMELDQMIQRLMELAAAAGVTAEQFQRRVSEIVAKPGLTQLLLVEGDPNLAAIVVAELAGVSHLPIRVVAKEQLPAALETTLLLVLPSKAEALRAVLAADATMHVLRIRSVPASLAAWLPARAETLVAIASRWTQFLSIARTMLVAAGFDAESLMVRDVREEGWMNGLEQAGAVVCDAATAKLVPAGVRVIEFRLLAAETLEEIRALG